MFGNVHPLGVLGEAKAQDAEMLIGQTELLVTALSPLQADLQPATQALEVAKSLYAAQEYSKAVTQAIRAGALAVSLNDRFNAYMAAWKDLQACRDELVGLGFPTDALEDALGDADMEVARRVEEDGTTVPNYTGATAMLVQAVSEARSMVGRARATSREIFLATLAVESLSEAPSVQVSSPLTLRLEEMVEQASRELALGRLPTASKLASEAKVRADAILTGAAHVYETLDFAEAILDGLGAEGTIAEALAEKIDAAREALDRGLLDRTTGLAVAQQMSGEVASFAKHFPAARKVLEQAEHLYGVLYKEGYRSDEVESALGSARRDLGAGDWTGVRAVAGRATEAFVRLREERSKVLRAIREVAQQVNILKVCRLRMLPEVEQLLSHAREQADGFRLSAAKEVLDQACAVLTQATQAGS